MKHLCFSKIILLILIFSSSLVASLVSKSAIVYYGESISYSMVGIHDYIIVNPKNTNPYTHGFDVYKNKMYAHVILNEQLLKNQKQLNTEPYSNFKNFYFEVDNSLKNSKKIIPFIRNFKASHQLSNIVFNSKYSELSKITDSLNAIIIDDATKLSTSKLEILKTYNIDLIGLANTEISKQAQLVTSLEKLGLVPYVADYEYLSYGKSSKNAIKREVLTLIDEKKEDRTLLGAHQVGAMPLEYLGYIQKLYDINNGLPDIDYIGHYAGVVIWLSQDYKSPQKLVRWVLELQNIGIKVAFANSFGFSANASLLKMLDIEIYDGDESIKNRRKVIHKDKMIGFEVDPSLDKNSLYMNPQNAKKLLTYEDSDELTSTPAAITAWGGYAVSEAFMMELANENVWIINPFTFFQEALRLKPLLLPDPTTENGNRLLFTHVDGDGMVSKVEFNPELFSGDTILSDILKVYKIPHSISLIGAEVSPNGLYPEFSPQVLEISKQMYALENVEPATHTFTHPFYWDKIKDGELEEEYRLKPKAYDFSLYNELSGPLKTINDELLKENSTKVAKSVFWSGDCSPRLDVLDYIYKNKILNINGGYTVISNTNPWLTLVSPFGLERGQYYQIYTGAQNENVYTNDWLGPFWGFKRVVQTFKKTNTPRRLKPIDIYYHLYSGSKLASLNALKYIFDWSLKQDVMPIFTSEYIPKVMDFYIISMANDGDLWLYEGMQNLKTLRIEEKNAYIDFKKSKTTLGVKHFEDHTYIALDEKTKHIVKISKKKDAHINDSYLISSNAKVIRHIDGLHNKSFTFDGHVDLKLNFHLAKKCKLQSIPKASKIITSDENIWVYYKDVTKATLNVLCR